MRNKAQDHGCICMFFCIWGSKFAITINFNLIRYPDRCRGKKDNYSLLTQVGGAVVKYRGPHFKKWKLKQKRLTK